MNFKKRLQEAIKSAVKELGLQESDFVLEHPENPEHGDYSSNIAMAIFSNSNLKFQKSKVQGEIQKWKNPLELAQEITGILHTSYLIPNTCNRIEAVAPGFINFWLSEETLSKELELALRNGERYGSSEAGKGKKVVVEYSSPNIAKSFGIGHLRSTIIGQTLYNLYQFLGYKAIGDNHLGDWGTQFGAIIYQTIDNDKDIDKLAIDDLERLYVDFNQNAKENPGLWEEARKWFKKLEEGDERAREIWKAAVKVSLEEFDRIYKLLGVSFENMHGESFYEDKVADIIGELKEKKLVVKDQGALIIKYPGEELPPGIILKSDGATTYLTRDLAQVKFRLAEWNPDLLIYEVGVEQTLHFRQLFGAVELLGWAKPALRLRSGQERFVHVRHGLYLGPGGQKFSTRRGETVKIEDVLAEAATRAEDLIKDKPEAGDEAHLSAQQKEELARVVGIGAVKYFDLSHNPESDIVFSWDKVFLLTGNSGPYLQYTYARTRSVARKSQIYNISGAWCFALKVKSEDLKPEELAILRTFYHFPEVVETAARQFAPNLLCNFLYDLASKYNLLYNNVRILEAEEGVRSFRLALTQATANILKTGLNLLGIETPERM